MRQFVWVQNGATPIAFSVEQPDDFSAHWSLFGRSRRARELAFALRPLPIPVPLLQPIHPTLPEKQRVERPKIYVANQLAFALRPLPIPVPLLQPIHPTLPEKQRVERPTLLVMNQLASTQISPQPEQTKQIALPCYQDRVERPRLSVASQQAVAFLQLQEVAPVTPVDLSRYPDRLALPRGLRIEHNSFVSLDESVQLDWRCSQPDRIDRIRPAYQQPFASPSQPERTAPIADVVYPVRIDRVRISHPDALTFVSREDAVSLDWQGKTPERIDRVKLTYGFISFVQLQETVIVDLARFTDRIDHPIFKQTTSVTFISKDETVQLDWRGIQPDRIDRTRPPPQQASVVSPQPERSSSIADVSAPVKLERPRTVHLESFSFITREETLQLDWRGAHPDRIDRTHFTAQQAVGFAPQPERSSSIVDVVYPSRFDRPRTTHIDSLIFVTREDVAPVDWHGTQLDRIDRVRPTTQQASAFASQPERSSSIAEAIYPSRLDRFRVVRLEPLSFVTRDEAVQLDWQGSYVDRTDRKTLDTPKQQAVAFAITEQTNQFDWQAIYQDTILTAYRTPIITRLVGDLDPESVPTFSSAVFPVRINRSIQLLLDQSWTPFTEEPTPPTPPSPAPPEPTPPSPGSFPSGPGAAAGGGGGWGYVPSMWAPRAELADDVEIVEENEDGSWTVEAFHGLPKIDKQPNIFIKQSIYNFASDVPEETRGRVVTLLQEFEGEDLFVRMANSFGSYDRALVAFQNQEMAKRRQVVVDISFDSAEELDRLTTIALSNGFFVESAQGKKLSLLAPAEEPKKIDFGLLDSLKVWLSQKQAPVGTTTIYQQPVKLQVVAPQRKQQEITHANDNADDEEQVFDMPLEVEEHKSTKLVKRQKKSNTVGWFAIGLVVGWLLSSAARSVQKPKPKSFNRKR